MLSVVYSSTLKDFLRPGRLVAWTLAAVVIGLLSRVWVRMGGAENIDQAYGDVVAQVVFRLVALAAAIFAPMVISQEVEQKTIIYWLTRAVPRRTMILGRTLAAFTASSFVAVIVSICVGMGVMGMAFISHKTFFPDLGLAIVGAAAYCTLFVMVSLLVNKALVWCLLFAFGWETFVPNMPGMAAFSIHSHMTNLQPDTKPVVVEDSVQAMVAKVTAVEIAPGTSWIVLLGTVVVLAALASWWFALKEFAPREDTE